MGGNAKHMPHVWEHLDHTFAEVFTLLEDLTTGVVEATEKFDGINMHFRVDASGVVRFSRNETDKSRGGVPFSKMLNDFASHPARETIIEGIRTIDEHFSGSWWPFGFSGRNWINAEIVYTLRPQLLKYDKNAIILHEVVTFLPDSKKLIDPDLQLNLEKVCAPGPMTTITGFEWVVLPPQRVLLPPRGGEGFLTEAHHRLRTCVESCGLTMDNTLRDFLWESLMRGPVGALSIGADRHRHLANRIVERDAPRLIEIKKGLPVGLAKQVSELGQAKNRDKVHRDAMQPVINTVTAFGASRLASAKSVLIEDGEQEINRLQAEIDGARLRINESDDLDASARQELFEKFMGEYNAVGGSPSPIEGITFMWSEKKTKLTGVFSTLNQAIGVDRYGRGAIGPTPQKVGNFNLAQWFGFV